MASAYDHLTQTGDAPVYSQLMSNMSSTMLLQMMQKVIYFTCLLLSILLFDESTNVGHHLYLAGITFIHSISACRATARFSVHQHQQAIGKATASNNSHQGREDCSKEEDDCTRTKKAPKKTKD